MISLTRLEEFKKRISQYVLDEPPTMVQSHNINTVKSHIRECYMNVMEITDGNVEAFEEALFNSMKKAINGVLGKKDELKKKTKG